MKINLITNKIENSNIIPIKTKHSEQTSNTNTELVSYPMNYYIPSFKGLNLAKMYEEYNWYIRNDKIPAIKSFLKMTAPKEEMDEFLTHILSTEDRSYELIDSIASMPRESSKIYSALAEKVGENSKNVMVFLPDSPYLSAYTKYIQKKYENFEVENRHTKILEMQPNIIYTKSRLNKN